MGVNMFNSNVARGVKNASMSGFLKHCYETWKLRETGFPFILCLYMQAADVLWLEGQGRIRETGVQTPTQPPPSID